MSQPRQAKDWWGLVLTGGCICVVVLIFFFFSCCLFHKWKHNHKRRQTQTRCALLRAECRVFGATSRVNPSSHSEWITSLCHCSTWRSWTLCCRAAGWAYCSVLRQVNFTPFWSADAHKNNLLAKRLNEALTRTRKKRQSYNRLARHVIQLLPEQSHQHTAHWTYFHSLLQSLAHSTHFSNRCL